MLQHAYMLHVESLNYCTSKYGVYEKLKFVAGVFNRAYRLCLDLAVII